MMSRQLLIEFVAVCLSLLMLLLVASPALAEPSLETRLHESQELTIETIKQLPQEEIRQHLNFRGDICEPCDTREKMLKALRDHVMAGTPCSTRKYTETSDRLRIGRTNPRRHHMGHDSHLPSDRKHRELRRRSREKREGDPKDPLSSLKDVFAAHGLSMQNIRGQEEAHDVLEKAKQRKDHRQFFDEQRGKKSKSQSKVMDPENE